MNSNRNLLHTETVFTLETNQMNCGKADDVIDFIVDNCHCLLTPDDVNVKCNIFKFDFAFQVAINRVLHGCDPDWDEHVELDEFD